MRWRRLAVTQIIDAYCNSCTHGDGCVHVVHVALRDGTRSTVWLCTNCDGSPPILEEA